MYCWQFVVDGVNDDVVWVVVLYIYIVWMDMIDDLQLLKFEWLQVVFGYLWLLVYVFVCGFVDVVVVYLDWVFLVLFEQVVVLVID